MHMALKLESDPIFPRVMSFSSNCVLVANLPDDFYLEVRVHPIKLAQHDIHQPIVLLKVSQCVPPTHLYL